MKKISQMILSTLKSRGYTPEQTTEGNETVIRFIINVTPVTFSFNNACGVVEFNNSYELFSAADEEHLSFVEKSLKKEDTPFTDAVYTEEDNKHLLSLAGRVEKDELTVHKVNAIVDTVERKDGIVAYLKELSYTNKAYRSVEDLAEAKEILDRAIAFFTEKGYTAKYFNEDNLQVDCEIGGGSFAITCEGTEYTFGIDCIYFTNEPVPEKDAERLVELFEANGTPFKYLFVLDDSINIEAEYPYSLFSTELLEDVIAFLSHKDGFAEAARRLSSKTL